jgi:CRP-like cAMP-binding protein
MDLDSAVLRRLTHLASLNTADVATLTALPVFAQHFDPNTTIVREGDRPSRSFFVLRGLVSSFKHTGDGRRQIPSFFVAGDAPDLHSLHLNVIDTSFRTITPCDLGFVNHEDLHRICEKSYDIARAMWRLTLVDGSIFREWETNIGQRDATTRMAHIFCEMYVRLKSVGLTDGYSYHFPVTQQEWGDAMGISAVHVNRTLQALRAEGLVRYDGNRVEIADWEAFQLRGDFDPAYLHLNLASRTD